ncbi:11637_t:CDS:2 [Acaulospora colombiana]|uniref:11637_t:CDS:1 n=1 Tax=Acaulospora colombiana TaxID=27376 RepID=A0ACA9NCS6_9GLOM|nr:11637_t:CDS:2 [Acaulospora colombiana]
MAAKMRYTMTTNIHRPKPSTQGGNADEGREDDRDEDVVLEGSVAGSFTEYEYELSV